MKSGPSRKSTRPSQKKSAHAPKPQPSTRKQKPALTRQERKEQGLCRCSQPAVQEQTRCAECAAKHREWNRQNSENRRRAKGIKPRPRIDDAELIEQIQKEIADQETRGTSQTTKRVRSEASKKKNQQHRAQVRAERKSFGLCVQCAKPSLEGQARCPDYILKHRQTGLRSRVKAKFTAGSIEAAHGTPRPYDYNTVPNFRRRVTQTDAGVVSCGSTAGAIVAPAGSSCHDLEDIRE